MISIGLLFFSLHLSEEFEKKFNSVRTWTKKVDVSFAKITNGDTVH